MGHDRPFVWIKPWEVAWASPRVGWGGVSGDYLGRATYVSRVDGDAGMMSATGSVDRSTEEQWLLPTLVSERNLQNSR